MKKRKTAFFLRKRPIGVRLVRLARLKRGDQFRFEKSGTTYYLAAKFADGAGYLLQYATKTSSIYEKWVSTKSRIYLVK